MKWGFGGKFGFDMSKFNVLSFKLRFGGKFWLGSCTAVDSVKIEEKEEVEPPATLHKVNSDIR